MTRSQTHEAAAAGPAPDRQRSALIVPRTSSPRVGLIRHRVSEAPGSSSSATVFRTIDRVIAELFPVRLASYWMRFLPLSDRTPLWEEFLRGCDLVITDEPVGLGRLREQLGLNFGMVYLPLGDLPRGASALRCSLPFYRENDAIVLTCSSDREILGSMVSSLRAGAHVLPLPVDQRTFRLLSAEARERGRSCLGIAPDDIVFLYAGRVTAEKNIHTMLSTLDEVIRVDPRVKVFIVGPMADVEFYEFGTGPYDMRRLVDAILEANPRLKEHVRFISSVHPDQLGELYGFADVFINLTLHHDENFGYAQAEAMSAGLPVVCTDWGGLKDTVMHGLTGFRVPTFVSGRGVQIDKVAAVKSCLALLDQQRRREMGRAAFRWARDTFSEEAFAVSLAQILTATAQSPAGDPDRGNAFSAFGQEFEEAFGLARTRYTEQNYSFYRRLIAPYCSAPRSSQQHDSDLIYLQPISFQLAADSIEILDPLWPGVLKISEAEMKIIDELDRLMLTADRSQIPVSEIHQSLRINRKALEDALSSLQEQGIVGRTSLRDLPAF